MTPDRRERIINLGFRLIVLALAAMWIAYPPQQVRPAEAPQKITGLVAR